MITGPPQVVPDNDYADKETDYEAGETPPGMSEFEQKLMEANAESNLPVRGPKVMMSKRRSGPPPIRQLAHDAKPLTSADIRAPRLIGDPRP